VSFPTISDKITSAVTDAGFVYTVGENGTFKEFKLATAFKELDSFTLGGSARDTSPGCVAFASDGSGNAHASPAGVGYLNNKDFVQNLNTSRTDFEQISFANNRLWARSSTSVCTSVDYGVTWDTVFVGSPRTFAVSLDNKILYILLQNGSLLRSYLPFFPSLFPGYSINVQGIDVSFVNNFSFITGASATLPPGLWSLSGGFSLKPADDSEDAVADRFVYFGLSETATNSSTSPNLTNDVSSYSTIYSLQRTWSRFNCSRVVKYDVPTKIYLRVRLNNTVGSTSTICNNPFLHCLLISN
jgi:hypothetical protein